MAILITGGLGVIGSRLAAALREHGYDVKVTDHRILKEPGYLRADVCEYHELDRVFREWPIEHVFHFAGEVGRENGELFPRRCVDINVSGTLNLIQLCREYGARLYFASSSEVYGERGAETLLTEELVDHEPVLPHNCYGISKLQAEQYIRSFRRALRPGGAVLPVLHVLRAAGVPESLPQRDDELHPPRASRRTHHRASRNRSLLVLHRRHRRRLPARDGGFRSQPGYQAYNLGNAGLIDSVECARLVCRLADASEDLVDVVEPGPFTTHVKLASFDKIRDHFGFEAKVDLEEGVRRTIEWQRENVPVETAVVA